MLPDFLIVRLDKAGRHVLAIRKAVHWHLARSGADAGAVLARRSSGVRSGGEVPKFLKQCWLNRQTRKSGSALLQPPALTTPPAGGKVKIMDGERVAFTEEGQPGQYLKLVASGEVDDTMLEALEDFVKRQRKRLAAQSRRDNLDDLVE